MERFTNPSAGVKDFLPEIFPKSSFAETQRIASNDLVSDPGDRKKFNLDVPVVLHADLMQVAETYGHGGKWKVVAASVAAFLRMSPSDRQKLVEDVGTADLRGDFRTLVPSLSGVRKFGERKGRAKSPAPRPEQESKPSRT